MPFDGLETVVIIPSYEYGNFGDIYVTELFTERTRKQLNRFG